MKKWIAVLMVAVMLVVSACGSASGSGAGSTASAQEGSDADAGNKDGTAEESETESADQSGTEDSETEDNSLESSVDESSQEDGEDLYNSEGLFTFGTLDGDIYENESIGYGCRLKGWTFADEDAIAAMNAFGKDMLPEELQEQIRSAETIYDMSAASPDQLQNVVINFQNLNVLYGALLSEETVVKLMLPQMKDMLGQAGYEDLTVEEATVKIAEDTLPAIGITGKINGVTVFQKEALKKCGGYIAYICATSFLTDNTDEIFEKFYDLKNRPDFTDEAEGEIQEGEISLTIEDEDYPWGTPYAVVAAKEITDGMKEGQDYLYNDSDLGEG